jgi:predicted RNase H-like HicB family nuclease
VEEKKVSAEKARPLGLVDTVEISLRLSCFVRDDGKYWVSGCPNLDVYSQDETREGAKEALREAIDLWIESCIERDTLAEALRELGWHRVPSHPLEEEADFIAVSERQEIEEAQGVLGEAFPVEVRIPAYQAAALLAGSHRAAC